MIRKHSNRFISPSFLTLTLPRSLFQNPTIGQQPLSGFCQRTLHVLLRVCRRWPQWSHATTIVVIVRAPLIARVLPNPFLVEAILQTKVSWAEWTFDLVYDTRCLAAGMIFELERIWPFCPVCRVCFPVVGSDICPVPLQTQQSCPKRLLVAWIRGREDKLPRTKQSTMSSCVNWI